MDPNKPEPTPRGTGREITPLVIQDLELRSKMGKEKYGEALRAFNGRNALVDAYQEAMDLVQYLRQKLEEEKNPLDGPETETAYDRFRRLSGIELKPISEATRKDIVSAQMKDMESFVPVDNGSEDAMDGLVPISPWPSPFDNIVPAEVVTPPPGTFIPVAGDPSRMSAREFLGKNRGLEAMRIKAREVENAVFASVPITIYLSGPMSGYPNYNIAEFERFAVKYRALGYTVISPHDLDQEGGGYDSPGHDAATGYVAPDLYHNYLRRDLQVLLDRKVTRMYMLPGWHKSKGARTERTMAEAIGIEIWDAETGQQYNETVVQEAQRLVHGDRGESYGHPIFDLTRTADMLTALLREKLRVGVQLEPEDVAKAMIAVKMSRETFQPKRDNRVDAAGYAEVLDLIVQWRNDNPGVDPRDAYQS